MQATKNEDAKIEPDIQESKNKSFKICTDPENNKQPVQENQENPTQNESNNAPEVDQSQTDPIE